MAWTEAERAVLLNRLAQLNFELSGSRFMEHAIEKINDFQSEETLLIQEYVENLPYFTFSRCPFCSEPASLAFDPYGLDGPWWWRLCPEDLPRHLVCSHFQVFLGALDLQGRQPAEATEEIMAGPARPFVINRLMIMKNVKAVLSTLQTKKKDKACLITYFSKDPIDQSQLHQEWRTESYPLFNEDGEVIGSESKYDAWDFDIKPWMYFDKLLWIAPGDVEMDLRNGECDHFDGFTGTTDAQVIGDGALRIVAPPVGQDNATYERD